MASEHGRQREPVFNAPTIVIVLITCLVVIHTVRQLLPHDDDAYVVVYLAFIPARLDEAGAGLPGGTLVALTSAVTHAFLHADWLHLTINGAWLLAFGALIARRCGPAAFLVLFAASAVAGALFFFLVNAPAMSPLVGASGGISGLMGAAFRVIFSSVYLGELHAMREHPGAIPRMPLRLALVDPATLTGVVLWLSVNLIFGLGLGNFFHAGDIAWEAHVGGFLFGFLLFRWFDRGPDFDDLRRWEAER